MTKIRFDTIYQRMLTSICQIWPKTLISTPPYTITLQFIKQYIMVNNIKRFPEINENTYDIMFWSRKRLIRSHLWIMITKASHRTHDVMITSLLHQNDVATSFRRNDMALSSRHVPVGMLMFLVGQNLIGILTSQFRNAKAAPQQGSISLIRINFNPGMDR